ncbi:hypothetical protein SMAC4_07344 [Sordaria macrospora]|uniref:uncharacterized protein n=1 Tax=Sordaria macrospora TaxID=5147 RepID=UPI001D903517|nr:hypothetical protein B0T09DRAFT_131958 [Sordaria sp. MPI-SDFR-AT-0083]WPJ61686.1 hypothetical protein SMAC4_07344 [Sordaria macrospora]
MGCCISRSSSEEGVTAPYPAGSRASRTSGSSRALNSARRVSRGPGGSRSPAPTTAAGTPAGSQLRGIEGAGSVTNEEDRRLPLSSHPPSVVGATTSYSNQQREQRAQRRQSRRHSQHRGDRGGDRESRRHSSLRNHPLSQHINKPLKRHEWISEHRVWTRATLDRERAEFFDTRVTGRQEVWQTIHAALEILWHQAAQEDAAAAQNGDGTLAAASDYEGEGQGSHSDAEQEEDDRATALATAQTILSAAEITLPTGDLAQGGAYDSLGNYYSLPEHVVSDPINISNSRPVSEASEVEDEEDGYADTTDTKGAMSVVTDGEIGPEGSQEALESGDEASSRREEKGKAVVNVKDLITVRARLSDGSKDVNVQVDKGDSVRVLGRKVAEKAKLSDKKVRLVYMGKILKETSTLPDQGWKRGNIVNALVFNR